MQRRGLSILPLLAALATTAPAREPDFREFGAVQESLSRVHPRMRTRWLYEHGVDARNMFTPKAPDSSGLRMVGKWGRGPSYEVTGRDTLVFLCLGSEVAIINFADPDNPEVLSEPQAMGLVCQAAVRDSFLYIGTFTGAAGIEIWNIADPRDPVFRSRVLTRLSDFCIKDSFAYVTARMDAPSRDTFKVFSLFDPANPRLVGSCPDSGTVAAVTGSTVILGDWDDVHLLDVSDPTHPARVGSYPGWAVSVAARNSLCCIAFDNPSQPGQLDFAVIDVTDPSQPRRLGHLADAGGFDVFLVDTLAFVSGYNTGVGHFQILSIADSLQPRLIGQAPTPGDNWGVWADLTRDRALVADGPEGLYVFDVADLSDPVTDTALLDAGMASDVHAQGDVAVVADDWAGVRLLDVSDPSEPCELSSCDTTGEDPLCQTAVLSDSFILAGWSRWPYFRTIDASRPDSLRMAGGCGDVQGRPKDIVVRDSFAYSVGMRRLHVLNVARPRSPVLVGSCVLPDMSYGMSLQDTMAFVTNWPLEIVSVANPASPAVIGSIRRGAWNVFVVDTLAFVAGGVPGLFVYDVADPANAVLLDSVGCDKNVFDVVVVDTLAYVSCEDGVRLFSVAVAGNSYLLGFLATPYGAWRLTRDGSHVYVACQEAGICVLETVMTGVAEGARGPEPTGIRAWPSPTAGVLFVAARAGREPMSPAIYDVVGTRIAVRAAEVAPGLWRADLSRRPDGVYVVRAMYDRVEHSLKVIKTRGR